MESELGKGSTFTLTIQANIADGTQNVKIKPHSLKVLLVEDIEVNVVVAKAMLDKFGCEVDVAMTGAEAYEKFAQNSYDLILLDIQLPDTTGFEIAQNLRQRYEQGEVDYLPLLVSLTANIIQTKEEYQQQGMDDVLRKPLSIEALSECLNYYFGEEFWENTAEKAPLASEQLSLDAIFDERLLGELIEVMGKEGVLANFQLFSKLMPDYVNSLEHNLKVWQETGDEKRRKQTADEAHKIKGALASVGLTKLQAIAQLAQTDNGENWQQGINDWVTQIVTQWRTDLESAIQWVTKME